MSRKQREITEVLEQIEQRLGQLEHAADMMKTVLMIKDPGSAHAADAYEGLRKQIVASSTARRTHLAQLSAMAIAVSRASELADLAPQVDEWLGQAGIVRLTEVPPDARVQDLFEDADGGSLQGATQVEVVEPVFVDTQNQVVVRLGRARRIDEPPAAPAVSAAQSDRSREDRAPLGDPQDPRDRNVEAGDPAVGGSEDLESVDESEEDAR